VATDPTYERLRDAIMQGTLHPNERLVEADLTGMLGSSRSAVRTALVRLEQEGVVEHERNRGAKVRVVEEAEAVEIYEARNALESFAARRAAAVATDADKHHLQHLIEEITGHLKRFDLRAASDANSRLHAAIIAVARQATVARLVASLNVHLVRYQFRTIMHPDRPERSLQEHSAIVEAIVANDEDAAESAMRLHLQNVTESLRRPLPGTPE
jgi:DNA-binding GntR family transcriptional regulator